MTGKSSDKTTATEKFSRSDDYRYVVVANSAELTPLAAVNVFFGPLKFQVLNISLGGVAILFTDTPKFSVGDIFDASIEIRERAYPVQLEIRGIAGYRVSVRYVNPSQAFVGGLREFLKPKTLGGSIKKSESLSQDSGQLALVEGAEFYEAYVGQNSTAFFCWMASDRKLLKIVGASGELVMEWTLGGGLRTARLGELLAPELVASEMTHSTGASNVSIKWDRQSDQAVLFYFADVLLSWLPGTQGSEFIESLMGKPLGHTPNTLADKQAEQGAATPIKFPKI